MPPEKTPTDRTFLDQATEWLARPLYYAPNRWEFLCLVFMISLAVWWWAHERGWNEGMLEGARQRQQTRRDELEDWHERRRQELRDDVRSGVAAALHDAKRDG